MNSTEFDISPMRERGIRLFPLQAGQKTPPKGSKDPYHQKHSDAELQRCVSLGVWLGQEVRPGYRLLVLDVESVEGHGVDGLATLDRLKESGADFNHFMCVETPSGGLHIYSLIPIDADLEQDPPEYKGIQFKSSGHVVAPGSPHPDFPGLYRLSDLTELLGLEPEPLPESVLSFLEKSSVDAAAASGIATAEQLASLLESVDPCAFRGQGGGRWFQFLAACHSTTGGDPEALAVFTEWSTGDPIYRDDTGEISKRWRSLTPDGGIGFPTLIQIARTETQDSDSLELAIADVDYSNVFDPVDVAELPPDVPSLTELQGRTEIANGERFAAMFRDVLRFDHERRKWFAWNGSQWAIDRTGMTSAHAKQVVGLLWAEAAKHRDPEIVKFAKQTASRKSVEAMLHFAQSERGVSVTASRFDRHPFLLNCPNGTVDLKTGELRPHRRDDFLTTLCPCPFDPNAQAPVFRQFLRSVFAESGAMIGFVQRWLGYCLTGDVREHKFLIAYGGGANGKSTLFNAVMEVVGPDYSFVPDKRVILKEKYVGHSTELMDLAGKRLATASETDDGDRLSEATVKNITGGDPIRGRRMREDTWQFDPTHKLILCTNHRPRVEGSDEAIWRRIILLPFERRFYDPDKDTGPPELRQDKKLPEKLRAEADGILTWMVRGAAEWASTGLRPPPEVLYATQQYRNDEDHVSRFIDERCQVADGARTPIKDLYDAYQRWCMEQDEYVVTKGKQELTSNLYGRGFQKKKYKSGWHILNFSVVTPSIESDFEAILTQG